MLWKLEAVAKALGVPVSTLEYHYYRKKDVEIMVDKLKNCKYTINFAQNMEFEEILQRANCNPLS